MSTIFADKFKNTSGGNPVQINQLRGIDTAGSITVQGEGTNTTNLQQGLAKMWLRADADTSNTVQDSFNHGSFTDNSTGNYSITFTNNMSNDDWSAVVSTDAESTIGGEGLYGGVYPTSSTASLVTITFRRANGNADSRYIGVTLHGDLA